MAADVAAPSLFVVGVNHRSSTVELRDRMYIDEARIPSVFERLRKFGIENAILLSTNDRVEVQGASVDPQNAARVTRQLFCDQAARPTAEVDEQIYQLFGDQAVRQIFSVASSLDSQVVGEPQILGQVQEGHRVASGLGMMGPVLEDVLERSYNVAKRIRGETEIERRPLSIARAASLIARDVHGRLSRASLLVVGLGEMGNVIATRLQADGIENVMSIGPSRRTETTARQKGWHFFTFDRMPDALAQADIVVCAAGTGRHLVTKAAMSGAGLARRGKPVLLLDVANPADVETAVQDLDGVYLYGLEDLERVAGDDPHASDEAKQKAEEILADEMQAWMLEKKVSNEVPAIVALRHQFEAARTAVLQANPKAGADEATKLLINRLLHAPMQVMQEAAGNDDNMPDQEMLLRWLRRLFEIDGVAGRK